jgi:protein-arginine kinase activator protein McsA
LNRTTLLALLLVATTALSGVVAAAFVQSPKQERKTKKVSRVKRPSFTEKDWDGIYFEDLFKDGLVGERPEKAKPGQAQTMVAQGTIDKENSESNGVSWSSYISGSVIEDEVKAQQALLTKHVTTPVKFKSEYGKVHQTFSILSMMFAVIREYDGDVRWKKFAPEAQISFERAAANSRVGTSQAYEFSKTRMADLAEMVRGGNFQASEKAPDNLEWPAVVDRTPIMKRLQLSKDALKLLSANEKDFGNGIDQILHESELIAVMGQALMKADMNDADDDGYLAFAKAMSDAAVATRDACRAQDYEAASKAINLIDQSCNNCHDEWK